MTQPIEIGIGGLGRASDAVEAGTARSGVGADRTRVRVASQCARAGVSPRPSSCEAMRRHSGYDRAEWQAVSGRSLWKPTVFKKLPRSTT